MGRQASSRNLPQEVAREHIPAAPRHGARGTAARETRRPLAEVAATIFGAATGAGMLTIAIWGFWVSADIARHVDTSIVGPGQYKLNAAIFLLSWLVLFGPFLFCGIWMVRSTFAPEERAWLVPLRVFTYIVSLRAKLEFQRERFCKDSTAKQLPQAVQKNCLDVPQEPPPKNDTS